MNFFQSTVRRKFLFACLYFSEGAPIGFIWLALPTQLRAEGVPIQEITQLTALLVLPWTLKFAWAPIIDVLHGPRWTLRHWALAAQLVMGATLIPLVWLEPSVSLRRITWLLLAHAFAAATQDASIDALCIATTQPGERGRYNGWMQAGMLLGRAAMGGGALVLSRYLPFAAIVAMLVGMTTFSAALLLMSQPPRVERSELPSRERMHSLLEALRDVASRRSTWAGLLFAATGGAAYKSLEVFYGPFLIDRGFDEAAIGWFSLGPMIGAMILGSLVGGTLADRIGPRRSVGLALAAIATIVGGLATADAMLLSLGSWGYFMFLAATAIGIGVFTSASYAMYMDITEPKVAATQFCAFMGATNGCESWSSYASGLLIARFGYPLAMLAMSCVSLAAIPLIWAIAVRTTRK